MMATLQAPNRLQDVPNPLAKRHALGIALPEAMDQQPSCVQTNRQRPYDTDSNDDKFNDEWH